MNWKSDFERIIGEATDFKKGSPGKLIPELYKGILSDLESLQRQVSSNEGIKNQKEILEILEEAYHMIKLTRAKMNRY